MHEQIYDGTWWVPTAEGRPLTGRLTFSPSVGPTLEIVGELLTDVEVARDTTIPFLFGTIGSLATGNDVTLVDVRLRSRMMQGRHTLQTFAAAIVFLGVHVQSCSTTRCEVSYDQLGPWLMDTGLELRYTDSGDSTNAAEYTVAYRTIEPTQVATPHGAVSFNLRPRHPVIAQQTIELIEEIFTDIVVPVPLEFDNLRRSVLWRLQNFLTFATDAPCVITRVKAWIARNPHPADVLFKHSFVKAEPADPVKMLFTFRDVRLRIADILRRWFELYETLGATLDQVAAALYGEYRLPATRFLAIVQALEAYHRHRFPLTDNILHEHQQRLERVSTACTGTDRKWLMGKLKYAYEPTLRVRLNALCNRVGQEFLEPMCGNSRRQRLAVVNSIIKLRNELTHGTITSAALDAAQVELHDLALQMLVVVKANILRDVGFEPSDLFARFRYNDAYRLRARRIESRGLTSR